MLNNYLNNLIQNSFIQAHDNRILKQSAILNQDEWDEEVLPRHDYLKFAFLNAVAGALDGVVGIAQTVFTITTRTKGLEGRVIHHALDSLWQSGHSLRYSFIHLLKVFQPRLLVQPNEFPIGIMGTLFLRIIENIANNYFVPASEKKNGFFTEEILSRLVYSSMLVGVIAGRVLDALSVIPMLPLAIIGVGISLCSKHEFEQFNTLTCQLLEFPMIIHDIVHLSAKIINPSFEAKEINHN